MGKKDKKKKGLGKAKTELKASRKAEKASRRAKEADDEDVEAILEGILAKEAELITVAEHHDVEPPTPRAAFSMISNPATDEELILFGGERYNGDRGTYFNDLHVFQVAKRSWSRYDSPTRPPPRSSHSVAIHKMHMYLFGGEFSNPSLSQYRHYRDLWRLDLEDMSWERIDVRGGPSPRSGHRMCVVSNKLIVFGGFYDSGYDDKYFNDLYYIDLTLDHLKWAKVDTTATDIVPSPRSGFQWVSRGNEVFLYGGYCKEKKRAAMSVSHKAKKKGATSMEESLASRGIVLQDSYMLTGDSLKWQKVKRLGYGPSCRAGFSLAIHKQNAILFGGVEDEETEEELESKFCNDLFGFSLDRKKWFPLTVREKGKKKSVRRRRKGESGSISNSVPSRDREETDASIPDSPQRDEDNLDGVEDLDAEDDVNESDSEAKLDEEIDALVLEAEQLVESDETKPCGRFNAAVAVSKNVMYIAGGLLEKGDREVTLDDIWSLDLNKLQSFNKLRSLSEESAKWVNQEETSSAEEDNEDDENEHNEKAAGGSDTGNSSFEHSVTEEDHDRKAWRVGRRDRLRCRLTQSEETYCTPKVGESLKSFFERTRGYWIGEVHEALGQGGKELRRTAFEWAFRRFSEVKPTLKELEDLEAELLEEAELERAFAKAQFAQGRGKRAK